MHNHQPPAKRIGIIAGSSPEAGIDLWSKVLQANRDLHGGFFRGDLDAPSVAIISEPVLGLSMELDVHHDQIWTCLKDCAQAMAQRADFYAIACNALDYFHPQLDALGLPGSYVSFVQVVQDFLERNQIGRVALLGARPVTDFGPWSPYRRLANHVEVELPAPTQAELLHRLIYDVKTFGSNSGEIRARFRAILNTLNSDTVLLACTELPLIEVEPCKRRLLDVTGLVAETLAGLANPQLFAQPTSQP